MRILRKTFLLLWLSAILHLAQGQSRCTLQSAYADFLSVEQFAYRDGFMLSKRVNALRTDHCAATAINANIGYFRYLVTHFSAEVDDSLLLGIADSLERHAAFCKAMRKATTLDLLMEDYNAKVLQHRMPKDSIPEHVLMDFAVKFFSIRKITPEGNYAAKVCAGLNDIVATEAVRMPHVEAFCFSAILKHYDGTTFNMQKEMIDAVRQLYRLNLGIDLQERLLRAQGALYMLMVRNDRLKAMLYAEYAERADGLPFVLVP
jgi:hypothetical protein